MLAENRFKLAGDWNFLTLNQTKKKKGERERASERAGEKGGREGEGEQARYEAHAMSRPCLKPDRARQL